MVPCGDEFHEKLDFLSLDSNNAEKSNSSLFHTARSFCRYTYYVIFTLHYNSLFPFLSSVGLGASKRQTQCPHTKVEQETERTGYLPNHVIPLFGLNNKAAAMQRKRMVHFWRPRNTHCRNGRKIKSSQVVWVTGCLYPVTALQQLLWLCLEGWWHWQH